MVSLKFHFGSHPSLWKALSMERLRRVDSYFASEGEIHFHEPLPHFSMISSTSSFTFLLLVTRGPKLNASQKGTTISGEELNSFAPSCKYPLNGSSTCCQGLVACGFLTEMK